MGLYKAQSKWNGIGYKVNGMKWDCITIPLSPIIFLPIYVRQTDNFTEKRIMGVDKKS
jgi:hypothetical protein